MIYTCTMNPAIDLFSEFNTFKPYIVNRSHYEEYQANGKAINISFVLKKIGIDSTATGFIGGFTGDFIEESLEERGIGTSFIRVNGITRINTFIRSGNLEYKAVNKGPVISSADQKKLLDLIGSLKQNDLLFVSGSLPRHVDDSILVNISRLSRKNGFSLFLDVSSKALLDCLPYEPEMIKPSDEELAGFLGVPAESLTSADQVVSGARQLLKRGVKHILVSRGEKGALYLDHDHIFMTNAPRGKVVNTACAGDTMLAAFAGSRLKGASIGDSLIFATAAASSTAFTAGLSNLQDIPELQKQIRIQNLLESGERS
ncbi:1-phosphofructokinase [Sporolactobacillus sp. THM7-7]|nr:1-phosphofructokinase [Sporolactobacillus sp. THM7-7]